MGYGFDYVCAVKYTLNSILYTNVLLIICINSFSLYKCFVKLGTIYEKRLIIDLIAIRQAYERREIVEVIWIKGESNLVDLMTKHNGNKALQLIIDTNKLQIDTAGWVERNADA